MIVCQAKCPAGTPNNPSFPDVQKKLDKAIHKNAPHRGNHLTANQKNGRHCSTFVWHSKIFWASLRNWETRCEPQSVKMVQVQVYVHENGLRKWHPSFMGSYFFEPEVWTTFQAKWRMPRKSKFPFMELCTGQKKWLRKETRLFLAVGKSGFSSIPDFCPVHSLWR